MDKKKEDFLKRLLATFQVEADEHIKALSSGLIQLEKAKDGENHTGIVETLYREAHSLKGAARSVDLTDIESICRHMEGVLRKLKHSGIVYDPGIFDVLHRAVDVIGQLNTSGLQTLPETPEIIRHLEHIENGTFVPPSQRDKKHAAPQTAAKTDSDTPAASRREILEAVEEGRRQRQRKRNKNENEKENENQPGTIRLSTQKLEGVLLQSEEMIYGKLSLNRFMGQVREVQEDLDDWAKKNQEVASCQIKNLQGKIKKISRSLQNDRRSIGTLIDTHLEDMKGLLMLPFSTLTEGFPKTVRDLARDNGKKIDIVIRGAGNEIDKRVLESIKDPLLHLIRNAVDHGIESPGERVKLGKPEIGTIHMTISRLESRKVEILLSDDGAGIDIEKIKEKSIRSGILSKEETQEQTDAEIVEMIFHSEFSTSPLITDLSGRGLGLTIAREKVEKLGGVISVETAVGEGTTLRITLPLALATFRGVLVKAGDSTFIIPTLNVERVLRVPPEEIKTVENRETIIIDNRVVSHVPLAAVLNLKQGPQTTGTTRIRNAPVLIQILVLSAGGAHIAFSVDQVKEEEEVLAKGLGNQLKRVINISGAALLSSTGVVPILNVPDLLKSAVNVAAGPDIHRVKVKEKKPKAILLVEDSITSRILLKNILESAGYRVTVAVDGLAGWTTLRQTPFDLVISDVDMPRMNGFELTAKIREDKTLSATPVVLVTGMENREDREKGMEVGADAYIIKSSFDQSNLLSVLQKIL